MEQSLAVTSFKRNGPEEPEALFSSFPLSHSEKFTKCNTCRALPHKCWRMEMKLFL